MFWFVVGVFVGLLIAGSYNDRIKKIKNWVIAMWGKIFSK